MNAQETDIKSAVVELVGDAFAAFCEDMSAMFGLQIGCRHSPAEVESFANVITRVPELSAVHEVKADGAINGTFYIIFDSKALFILSGSVIMMPKPTILGHAKEGTLKEAEELRDATQGVGNLLIDAWDRIFHEHFEGHGHFVKGSTFIGQLQDMAKQDAGITVDGQYTIEDCEINVGDFPVSHCIIMFPQSILSGTAEKKPVDAAKHAEQLNADKPADTAEPTETPKAQAETKQEEVTDNVQKPADTSSQDEIAPQAKPVIETGNDSAAPTHPLETIRLVNNLSEITAGDIMNRDTIWASPDDSVEAVEALMQKHNTGYVLVGSTDDCHGIISRSDINRAVSPFLQPEFAKWRRPMDDASLQIKVKWITSTPVHTVGLYASLDEVISNMCDFEFRCLPVVNADGRVMGIITVFDVLKVMTNNSENKPPNDEPIQIAASDVN